MGHSCCYRSEYEAFGDALWPRTNATARDEVAILTDSPTLVWRMEKGTVQQERKDCSVIYTSLVIAAYSLMRVPTNWPEKRTRRTSFLLLIRTPMSDIGCRFGDSPDRARVKQPYGAKERLMDFG